jgi:hypothetical protein
MSMLRALVVAVLVIPVLAQAVQVMTQVRGAWA